MIAQKILQTVAICATSQIRVLSANIIGTIMMSGGMGNIKLSRKAITPKKTIALGLRASVSVQL